MESIPYIVIAILAAAAAWFFTDSRGKTADIKRKDEIIEAKDKNLKNLKNHQELIKDIQKNNTGIEKKIQEATSEEEIFNTIFDIIDYNNSRVPD